ncbi:hypothetical protein [Streptomyces sp. NPDC049879]|uniref:hypothetical protein n=1 Tax=Streptomyces sp. NPDC049879 TaxID=3365598 RepID=UPI00379AD0EE
MTVTAAVPPPSSASPYSYNTSSTNVKFRHWAVDKPTYGPGDGYTDYNTQEEADGAVKVLGGRAQKVDRESGLPLA